MEGRTRVLLDLSAAANLRTGIGRYARSILGEALPHLRDYDLTGWFAPDAGGEAIESIALKQLVEPYSNLKLKRGRIGRRRADQLWFRLPSSVPAEWFTGNAKVVYSPDFTAPPVTGSAKMMTIHDLAFRKVPQFVPAPLVAYLTQVVPRQIASAHQVMAVSEQTRTHILESYPIAPESVHVASCGVSSTFLGAQPLSVQEQVTLGLPNDYLLCVGTIEPRKNHTTLFQALSLIPIGSRPPLVLAGARGFAADEILSYGFQALGSCGLIVLDHLPEVHLPGLYAGARASIYPSWFEGFGLPVLESLAAGTPTIASPVPAAIEMGGGLAVLIDPASAESITAGVITALGSDQQSAESRVGRELHSRLHDWSLGGATVARVIIEAAG